MRICNPARRMERARMARSGEAPAMRARPTRRRQPEAVRQRVLEAALTQFAELGFEGATMQAIAETSGASIALIVYHFASKRGVWEAVVEWAAEPHARRLAA